VNCPGCGGATAPGFAFCPRCGRRLPRDCAACGFACAPDFAFCPRCGASLEAAPAPVSPAPAPVSPAPAPRPEASGAAEADRRLVTVLFADVSGFTSLSERLDPEDVRAFQNDLFKMFAEVIEQFGGFVEKFVGDAVMAVFGAPIAHEDDPERALRAALLMLDRLQVVSARWEICFGGPVKLHLGINTGSVVAGRLGAASDAAYAVTGDTVNTAARLLSASEEGQVLVSGVTRQLTAHVFAFDPLPPLTVRGKAEPVEVWRLRGLADASRPAQVGDGAGLAARLVGRQDELQQMLAAFDRVLGGRAQVVTLVGEAGTGKSRLVSEFLGALERDGRLSTVQVRHSTCSSFGEQTYGVVRAFLREGYQLVPEDSLEAAVDKLRAGLRGLGSDQLEAERLAPILAHMLGLGSDETLHQVEPEQLSRQIFLATRLVLERRLHQGPLILIVENLHWADAASVELLRFVADRLHDRPLMLLAATRPEFDTRSLLAARVAHTSVRLAPLGDADSAALLEELLNSPGRALPPALYSLVVRRAGGNPLYVLEIVRSLIAAHVLTRTQDGWICARDDVTADVPPTIHGLLLSRVDQLPTDDRRLLQEAAVLGLVFDREVLREMAGGPERFEASLDRLQEAELIEEVSRAPGAPSHPGFRYRFSQALVQEVVYQNLLLSRRTEAHDRAGRAYARLCGDEPQRLDEIEALGHHLSLGADRRRGARLLLAAGDRARDVYANEDARRHYERALRTLRESGAREEQCPVRERLGDLLSTLGRRPEAIEHYEAVRGHCLETGDRRAQARLYRKLGGLHWDAGERDRALECFSTGLALLEGGGDDVESAHLYQEMGRLAFRSGDNQRAIEWAERALTLTEGPATDGNDADTRREAAAVVSHACNTIGVALARTDRASEAVTHIERSIAVALGEGLLQAACRGYTNLGILYSTLDPSRGISTCLEGLQAAKRVGDLGVQSRLYANLAVAYCALTDRCEVEGIEAAKAAIELDRQLGQLDHLAVPLIVLGQIYQCHGDSQLSLDCYLEALRLVESTGEPQLLFPCYDGLATLHLDLGDQAEAERYLTLAQEVCERAGLDPDSLVLLPFLG
jgi:adenylate cyclase